MPCTRCDLLISCVSCQNVVQSKLFQVRNWRYTRKASSKKTAPVIAILFLSIRWKNSGQAQVVSTARRQGKRRAQRKSRGSRQQWLAEQVFVSMRIAAGRSSFD